jgi:PIN domain nuclease of toxin-antitoxin system
VNNLVCLDSCVLLWLADHPDLLSSKAKSVVGDPAIRLIRSAISAWEIALKQQKDRLDLPCPARDWWQALISAHGIEVQPINDSIAIQCVLEKLPYADPADRMIVATARAAGARLLTADQTLLAHCDLAYW